MAYGRYEKRVMEINKWFDTYVHQTFRNTKQFGHLEKYHINKSDEFLQERCKRLKRNVSTFCGDKEDICQMLVDVLIQSRTEIIEYLADEEDDDVWELIGKIPDHISGKIYCSSMQHDWSTGAMESDAFIISLKKNPHNRNLFVVTSAYPII